LRRELRSAERLSDAAIFFALVCLKTPCFRSSALLSCVTRCGQRFGDAFFGDDFSALNLPSSLSFYAYVCWPFCALLPCANRLFFDAQP
jgi:hypothetical protein